MALSFDPFNELADDECAPRIGEARKQLGEQALLLCHHYQRPDIYKHADMSGDSLKLSRFAAESKAEYIVFCGVHFMAEVADLLSSSEQIAILPDLAAGCSMADMANLAKVERCWRELGTVLDVEGCVTPVTYINSAADLKAFCGQHGGIVCTSSNAQTIAEWALQRREKILFFPDQHLGRWTGHQMGIDFEAMPVWDPDKEMGGLTSEQIKQSRFLLWKGFCSVHQMFNKRQIDNFRQRFPQGQVIVHPECSFEVCLNSDHVGSTETIVKTVSASPPGTTWMVGTELNLVERLAQEMAPHDKKVFFMADSICMCSTMQRIDPQHLCWTLENLVAGEVVNKISVPANEAAAARLSIERMLSVSR